jgi:RNA polymerase sigma-70 factor, ECF subfamily
MGLPPMVFETIASTVPPLRHMQEPSIPDKRLCVKFLRLRASGRLMRYVLIKLFRCLFSLYASLNQPASKAPALLLKFAGDSQELSAGPSSMLLRMTADQRAGNTEVATHRRPSTGSAGGPNFDEQVMIAAAQQGDLPAFNQLILHYQSLAYNVAYRIMGDPDSAADATQDGFIKAFRKINQYRGGSFKSWILRIVTNTCYDALRARKRRPTSALEQEDEDPDYDARLTDSAERPEEYVVRQELGQLIQAAIEKLPLDQRTALVLADIQGLDYQEIAEATGAALGTVKSRLSRARAKVRDLLMAQKELLPAQYRLYDSLG